MAATAATAVMATMAATRITWPTTSRKTSCVSIIRLTVLAVGGGAVDGDGLAPVPGWQWLVLADPPIVFWAAIRSTRGRN